MHVSLISLLLLAVVGASTIVSSGLQNLGNTCYLNAQLQCAYHIPKVRKLVLEVPATDVDPDEAPVVEESIAIKTLRALFADMDATSRPASPRSFCRALGISFYEQQDSQEFWKLLLPALQRNDIVDLYQGAWEDTLRSIDGEHEKRREEAFLDWSLDVTPTLLGSIQKHFELERLSVKNGNGWRPTKGADPVDADKGLVLKEAGLPSILQCHLKRFQFDWETETTSKLNQPVVFPLELDLSTVCKDSKDLWYDLQAIVVHMGEYGHGHYYAYVRPDVREDTWYRYNDEVVEEVSLEDVLADAFGGKTKSPRRGPLSWLRRPFAGGSCGFGGPTSSAYVLQYIRRSEADALYDC